MTTSPAQPTSPLLHNRYRITARLGENRLAVVYRGLDERLNRQVLVHVLRPQLQDNEQLLRRFNEEAQALARRNHPALLELFDSGEVGGRPYMITEAVEGHPLAAALPLPLPRALQILRQVVGGVATTLATHTPTPPISSKTVLLTDAGRPVLTEAWWLTGDELRLEQAHYRAPERTLGSPPDERNVVYTLGILAYELISGQRPFSGTDPVQVQNQHVQRSLPSAMDLANGFAPSLAAALGLATARDPQTRTPDVQSLARDLAAVEAVSEAQTRPLVLPIPKLRESVREAIKPITQRRSQPVAPQSPSVAPSASAAPVRTMPPPRPQIASREAGPARPAFQPPVGMSPEDIRREVKREVKREARRQGCLRFVRQRLIGLIFLGALLGGCYWGGTYGINWVNSGQARTWACGYLPPWGCDLLPLSTRPATLNYRTTTGVNIRNSPVFDPTNQNVIVQVPAGTPVTGTGEIRAVEEITWIRIHTMFENRQIEGWVSLELLQQEEAP